MKMMKIPPLTLVWLPHMVRLLPVGLYMIWIGLDRW
jgi:hypothetical protein